MKFDGSELVPDSLQLALCVCMCACVCVFEGECARRDLDLNTPHISKLPGFQELIKSSLVSCLLHFEDNLISYSLNKCCRIKL